MGFQESKNAFFEHNARWGGLVTIIAGLIFGKFFIYDVIENAEAHADTVTTYHKGVALSVACVLVGAAFLVFGAHVKSLFQIDPQNLSAKNIVLLLLLAGAGIAMYAWVQIYLSSLGYE